MNLIKNEVEKKGRRGIPRMEYIERFGLLEKQKTWHRKKNVVWRRIVESNQSQDGILDDDGGI